MKVILNQAVPKVGKEGQVVNVADGFARNFLFPRGLAVLADRGQLKALELKKARTAARMAEGLAAAKELGEKLHGQTIRLEGKVGKDSSKLFGAITSQDIADALKSQLGQDVERKRIALVQPIKRLGVFDVMLDLHPEVDATIKVDVFDPNAPVETAASEEAAEEA